MQGNSKLLIKIVFLKISDGYFSICFIMTLYIIFGEYNIVH